MFCMANNKSKLITKLKFCRVVKLIGHETKIKEMTKRTTSLKNSFPVIKNVTRC